jgi:hypothetical protein
VNCRLFWWCIWESNLRRAKSAAISFSKSHIVNLFSRQTLSTGQGIQISACGVARPLSSNRNVKPVKKLRGCLLSAFFDDRSYKLIRVEAASQLIRNAQETHIGSSTQQAMFAVEFIRLSPD